MPPLFLALFLGLGLACSPAHAYEIALVQYNADAHFGDYKHNLAQLTRFAEQAVAHGSKVIVFPEGSLYGYANAESAWCAPGVTDSRCHNVQQAAEPIPAGKSSVFWRAFASRHHVYVLFNLPEEADERFYNTTVVMGPEGYVTRYRKRALYVTDTLYATPGDLGPVSFQTPYGSFGLLLCMDGNYPQYYQGYKAAGLERVIIMMDWDQDPEGKDGGRPARLFFQTMAQASKLDLFISDVSPWDGTGAYFWERTERARAPLPTIAIGQDGVAYQNLD